MNFNLDYFQDCKVAVACKNKEEVMNFLNFWIKKDIVFQTEVNCHMQKKQCQIF